VQDYCEIHSNLLATGCTVVYCKKITVRIYSVAHPTVQS